jgi:LysR family transcriptional regulator, hydrogen peroxide-inducible genes activator
MTLTQFEYIVAVDKHRHFGKAAADCHITQPTLSMQIQKLEEDLGVLIFDRSKQQVKPTEIGEQILAQAKVVLREAKLISSLIDEEKSDLKGEIKLGIIPTLSPYLLPLFIGSFLKKYPQVKIEVQELLTDDITEKIQTGHLDLGVVVTPLNLSYIRELPLFYEEFLAYVSPKHPAYQKKTLCINELDIDQMWLLQEGHCFRDQVVNLCKKRDGMSGIPGLSFQSGSLESLKKLVDKHDGITLLPELAVFDLNEDDFEKVRYFEDPKPLREVSLVMHQGFMKRKLVESLFTEIQQNLPLEMNRKKEGKVIKWR